MLISQVLQAKTLIVNCRELNDPYEFNFKAYEFSNGLILVESNTTNDWFFANRDLIEPCGTAVVTSIEDGGTEMEFTTESLLKSIQGAISEFGVNSVPAKHADLWRKPVSK